MPPWTQRKEEASVSASAATPPWTGQGGSALPQKQENTTSLAKAKVQHTPALFFHYNPRCALPFAGTVNAENKGWEETTSR